MCIVKGTEGYIIYIASNCPMIHKLSYSIQSEIKFIHHNNCSYITIVIINHKIYRNYHKDICVSIIAVKYQTFISFIKISINSYNKNAIKSRVKHLKSKQID